MFGSIPSIKFLNIILGLKLYSGGSYILIIFSELMGVFTKNPTACTNEILVKCLVHNICCLIQEIFTLGIKVDFNEGAERIFVQK